MLDVSAKTTTLRTATAEAVLRAGKATLDAVREGKVAKGNPFEVAKVAAVQAAKNTSQIIPYCHPMPVDYVGVEFETDDGCIRVITVVKAVYKTGVEMEALTAASVAVLTLYDMLKIMDADMEITGVKLVSKAGGKSDYREIYGEPLRAAVVVMSDSVARGEKDDLSGRTIVNRLQQEGLNVTDYRVIPDSVDVIRKTLRMYADEMQVHLVLTTGGTGFGPRDNTPEVMNMVIEREIPGIPEALRDYGQERTPYAMLSRGKAGIRGKTVIINLPGSRRGVNESLDALFPGILHSFKMLWGGGHPAQTRQEETLMK